MNKFIQEWSFPFRLNWPHGLDELGTYWFLWPHFTGPRSRIQDAQAVPLEISREGLVWLSNMMQYLVVCLLVYSMYEYIYIYMSYDIFDEIYIL